VPVNCEIAADGLDFIKRYLSMQYQKILSSLKKKGQHRHQLMRADLDSWVGLMWKRFRGFVQHAVGLHQHAMDGSMVMP
jgi:hypothetical protein